MKQTNNIIDKTCEQIKMLVGQKSIKNEPFANMFT